MKILLFGGLPFLKFRYGWENSIYYETGIAWSLLIYHKLTWLNSIVFYVCFRSHEWNIQNLHDLEFQDRSIVTRQLTEGTSPGSSYHAVHNIFYEEHYEVDCDLESEHFNTTEKKVVN